MWVVVSMGKEQSDGGSADPQIGNLGSGAIVDSWLVFGGVLGEGRDADAEHKYGCDEGLRVGFDHVIRNTRLGGHKVNDRRLVWFELDSSLA
jgi:hypothetical protein